MNASFDRHVPAAALCALFPAQVWEEYAMGMQPEGDCTSLEEHLLICSACQDMLAEVDEYLEVAKAAMALLAPLHVEDNPPAAGFRTRPRWSKPMAQAATVTGALLVFWLA
jgi:hypothetical protein